MVAALRGLNKLPLSTLKYSTLSGWRNQLEQISLLLIIHPAGRDIIRLVNFVRGTVFTLTLDERCYPRDRAAPRKERIAYALCT